MARGGFPGMGMGGNMQQLARQAQKLQQQMTKMQEELEEREYEATAGGGMVKATMTGDGQLTGITIDPEALNPEDVDLLQDMIVAAVNEASNNATQVANQRMGAITGGLNIPGLF